MAWGAIVTGFMLFCAICTLSTLGLSYFLFSSTVPMDTLLQAGHGTVGVRERTSREEAESRQRDLLNTTTIRTDTTNSLSQSTLSFRDPGSEQSLVAVVTLRSDTTVTFSRATRPRFEWSSPVYEIELRDLTGRVDIYISENLSRDIVLRVFTPYGAEARILHSGRYVVEATLTNLTVTNRGGEVILIGSDRQTTRSIPEQWQGVLQEGGTAITLSEARRNLVQRANLQSPYMISQAEIASLPPGEWGCFVQPVENRPVGTAVKAKSPDGRDSLRLVRGGGADTNGEVRCIQKLLGDAVGGVDISSYDYVAVQMTGFIEGQSVMRCGQAATECPLMVALGYFVNGTRLEWRDGLFTRDDLTLPYAQRCDTCWSNPIQVLDGAWYTYDSGNLLTVIPPNLLPEVLADITFYAAGHEFEVYVDHVAVIVGQVSDEPSEPLSTANNG